MQNNDINKKTILVVDDTPDNLFLVSNLLKDLYIVKVANSGEKALKYLNESVAPDLILLDIMMPLLSGYDVIKKIKMIIINDRIVVQQTNTKMLLIFITSKKISSRSRRLKYPQRTINAIPDIILDGVNTETISVFHF